MNNHKKLVLLILAIFVVGMTLSVAFAEPVNAKKYKSKKSYKLGSKKNPRKKVNYKYYKKHRGERNRYYKNYYYLNGALFRDDNKYIVGAGTFTYICGKNPYA